MKKLVGSFILFTLFACSLESPKNEQSIKGIGPIDTLILEPINDSIMKIGMNTFTSKCTSCHTMEYKNSGPDLSNILARRQPEWVMNYLLNQKEMLEKDSISIKTNQKFEGNCNLTITSQEEAFALLEYFRIYQIWLHEFNAK